MANDRTRTERVGRWLIAGVCIKELGGLAGLWSTITADVHRYRHRPLTIGLVYLAMAAVLYHFFIEEPQT